VRAGRPKQPPFVARSETFTRGERYGLPSREVSRAANQGDLKFRYWCSFIYGFVLGGAISSGMLMPFAPALRPLTVGDGSNGLADVFRPNSVIDCPKVGFGFVPTCINRAVGRSSRASAPIVASIFMDRKASTSAWAACRAAQLMATKRWLRRGLPGR